MFYSDFIEARPIFKDRIVFDSGLSQVGNRQARTTTIFDLTTGSVSNPYRGYNAYNAVSSMDVCFHHLSSNIASVVFYKTKEHMMNNVIFATLDNGSYDNFRSLREIFQNMNIPEANEPLQTLYYGIILVNPLVDGQEVVLEWNILDSVDSSAHVKQQSLNEAITAIQNVANSNNIASTELTNALNTLNGINIGNSVNPAYLTDLHKFIK